jgi:deazaflavin-dependent oxidoreductase (nitroreductase family)
MFAQSPAICHSAIADSRPGWAYGADMALGRKMATFNRHVTNRVLGPLAPRLPAFGVLVHVGRRSGRHHRTPVNVFRTPAGYVLALTYASQAEWVKNVLAAGGCELVTRGRRQRLERPRLFRDERRSAMPAPVRAVLRLAGSTSSWS